MGISSVCLDCPATGKSSRHGPVVGLVAGCMTKSCRADSLALMTSAPLGAPVKATHPEKKYHGWFMGGACIGAML